MKTLPLLALCLLAPAAAAQDWPQWRGPALDNISRETEWSPVGKAQPLWRVDIGTGYSSPIIAGGRVYTTGYFDSVETPGEGEDRVMCFDVESGERVWMRAYPALIYDKEHAGGVLSTPTFHDDVLYVASREGGVRAYAAADGALLWEVDLVERHGVDPQRYGFSSSPYVIGDDIVLNMQSTVRLARATGETVWISENYQAPYATVREIRLGEVHGLVVFGKAGVVVLDAASGAHVRTHVFTESPRNVEGATPIVLGTQVFQSSGYENGGQMIEFAGEEPALLWSTRRMRTKMAGATLFGRHLYGFDESMLKCVDMQGEEQWRVRGLGQGALSIANGKLLVSTSDGELIVAEATPDEFRELSRNAVIDGGVFWATPVLVGGRIYLRGSLGDLACLDHRTPGQRVTSAGPAVGELPSPAELVARHLKAAHLEDGAPAGLTFAGRLHVKALGLDDVAAQWQVGGGARWRSEIVLPESLGGATIHTVFDGELGWSLGFRGPTLIEGDELAEMQRTGGYQTLFTPLPAKAKARTVGRESFRGIACVRVDVEIAQGVTRSVYFDERTGLLAGRNSPKESTVLFGEWREVGGLLLPFHRTEFDSEIGEESKWRFTEATLAPLDDELFAVPDAVRELLEKGDAGDGDR